MSRNEEHQNLRRGLSWLSNITPWTIIGLMRMAQTTFRQCPPLSLLLYHRLRAAMIVGQANTTILLLPRRRMHIPVRYLCSTLDKSPLYPPLAERADAININTVLSTTAKPQLPRPLWLIPTQAQSRLINHQSLIPHHASRIGSRLGRAWTLRHRAIRMESLQYHHPYPRLRHLKPLPRTDTTLPHPHLLVWSIMPIT